MKKGGRPRNGSTVYVRDDGQSSLSLDAFNELQVSAEERGILRLKYIGWDVEGDSIAIWPVEEKSDYAVSLRVYPNKSIQFRSRKLAQVAGTGKKGVMVL